MKDNLWRRIGLPPQRHAATWFASRAADHNSEEHHQKYRQQKREFQSGIAAPFFPQKTKT
jgi:hypothetical protein